MSNRNKKYYQTLFLIIFLTAYSLPLKATIRFVSKTGLSIPPYITWETAADSIQECINVSVFGDTIYVANGVYEEQVVMIPGLSLIGAGADSCEINTQAFATTTSYRSVIVKDTCLFKGFKIVVANSTELGGGVGGTAFNSLIALNRITNAKYGVSNGSNAVIYNNIIENISTGMDIFNSNALVRNNTIYTDPNSQSAIIAGIRVGGFNNNYTPIIDSNYIETKFYGIYKNIGSRPTITNNVIVFNPNGAVGMRFSTSDSAFVFNNLFLVKSGIYAGTGIRNYGTEHLLIHNNQIVGNYANYMILMGPDDQAKNNGVVDAQGWISAYSGGNLQYKYNNVWNSNVSYSGFTLDSTNLSVDPMIVNDDTTQGELDFHLQKYSPLIDAGDPNILDRDGSRSDIGLYGGPYGETYTYQDLAPRPPHNLTAVIEGGLVKLSWNKNTEADFSHYRVYRDTVTIVIYDSSKMIAETPDTFYYDQLPPVNRETRFYYVITAFDNQGNQSYPSEEINVLVTGLGEQPPKGYDGYRLLANYPNPFNPSTIIPYRLKERGHVRLSIYDLKGELVRILVNEWQERGYYEVVFQPNADDKRKITRFEVMMGKTYSHLSSGMYIYSIQVVNENNIPVFTDMEKMILLK
jgi:hypothetical protein